MKIFAAGMGTETNSFCPLPTVFADFQNDLFEGFVKGKSGPFQVWDECASAADVTIERGSNLWAYPAGPLNAEGFNKLVSLLVGEITAAQPFDLLLLNLHGAMIALSEPDCEGALLEELRRQLDPSVIIAVLIDPHAHLTERMVQNSNLIIAYKEFPHDDIGDRAKELISIGMDAVRSKILPVMCIQDGHQLSMINTKKQPGLGLVDSMKEMEQLDGVLSASLVQGFAWGDVNSAGLKSLVIADDDPAMADELASELVNKAQSVRTEIAVGTGAVTIDEALDQAEMLGQAQNPLILCESADNITGGGAGDATHILDAIVKRRLEASCFGVIWDPVAVSICNKAGEGAEINLRLGGKSGTAAGNPVDLLVKIEAIKPGYNHVVSSAKSFLAGDTVHLSTDYGLDIIISSERFPVLSPSVFTDFGIALRKKKLISIKGFHMARLQFSEYGDRFCDVITGGAMSGDVTTIPYQNMPKTHWPLAEA